jgi:hypothetical protein
MGKKKLTREESIIQDFHRRLFRFAVYRLRGCTMSQEQVETIRAGLTKEFNMLLDVLQCCVAQPLPIKLSKGQAEALVGGEVTDAGLEALNGIREELLGQPEPTSLCYATPLSEMLLKLNHMEKKT